jgi:hypothetical protein
MTTSRGAGLTTEEDARPEESEAWGSSAARRMDQGRLSAP